MATVESEARIKITAENQTKSQLEEVGKDMEKVGKKATGLSTSLTKIGAAAAATFAVGKVFNFLKEAAQMANEDAAANRQLYGTIQNLGLNFDDLKPKIDDYVDSMSQLGQSGGETTEGLTKLIRTTGDLDKATKLSTLASDLASSGVASYSENVDLLAKIMQGNGAKALKEYGVKVSENSTITEQLSAAQGLVTQSTEAFAKTSEGSARVIGESYNNLKTGLGQFASWFVGQIAETFGGVFSWVGSKAGSIAKTVASFFSQIGFTVKYLGEVFAGVFTSKDVPNFFDAMDKHTKDFEASWAKVLGADKETGNLKKNTQEDLKKLSFGLSTTAQNSSKAADKVKDSFRDISRAVIDAMNDQKKAIDALKKSQQELSDQLDDAILKSNEKYNQDVSNLARNAKERIDQINKQIEDERNEMSEGFRARIAELEKQKQKEQSIIERSSGIVSSLQTEIAKDDLARLMESHENELKEMRQQAAEKKKEYDDELAARNEYLRKLSSSIFDPNFYKNSTRDAQTFLGSIGQGTVSQQLVFNFNGTVAGDEGVKKIIEDTVTQLNRTATLNKVGGK